MKDLNGLMMGQQKLIDLLDIAITKMFKIVNYKVSERSHRLF